MSGKTYLILSSTIVLICILLIFTGGDNLLFSLSFVVGNIVVGIRNRTIG